VEEELVHSKCWKVLVCADGMEIELYW